MGKRTPPDARKPVLSDHRREGKRLIPPLLLDLGPFDAVDWRACTLPELLWIGALNAKHGLQEGAALAVALARSAVAQSEPTSKKWLAPISAYSELTAPQKQSICDSLAAGAQLAPLSEALLPLCALYPECPLGFLVSKDRIEGFDFDAALPDFKVFLEGLMYKYEPPATFVQATSIYIAFITDILKVVRGTGLDEFPEIEAFPETEKSRRVAASVYASVNAFMGMSISTYGGAGQTLWAKYFWNRGMELDPCSLEKVYSHYEE